MELGFSLAEIAELPALRVDPDADCADVRRRALAKLQAVARRSVTSSACETFSPRFPRPAQVTGPSAAARCWRLSRARRFSSKACPERFALRALGSRLRGVERLDRPRGMSGLAGLRGASEQLLGAAVFVPLTFVLLFVVLGSLVYGDRRRREWKALTLGVFGAAVVLYGRLAADADVVVLAGAGLLLSASIWNGWVPVTPAYSGCPVVEK